MPYWGSRHPQTTTTLLSDVIMYHSGPQGPSAIVAPTITTLLHTNAPDLNKSLHFRVTNNEAQLPLASQRNKCIAAANTLILSDIVVLIHLTTSLLGYTS